MDADVCYAVKRQRLHSLFANEKVEWEKTVFKIHICARRNVMSVCRYRFSFVFSLMRCTTIHIVLDMRNEMHA